MDAGRASGAKSSLATDVRWQVAGHIMYVASQGGMLFLLSWILGPDAVGLLALGLAVTTPIFFFFQLSLRQIQASDASNTVNFATIYKLRLLTTGGALLTSGVAAWFLNYRGASAGVVAAVALAKSVEGLTDICYGRLEQAQVMRPVGLSLMLRGSLGLLGFVVALLLLEDVIAACLFWATAWAGVLVMYDWPKSSASGAHRDAFETSMVHYSRTVPVIRLMWTALPLGLAAMLVSLHSNAPRYIIESYRGLAELGIYALLAYLVTGWGVVVWALGRATLPRLSRHLWTGNTKDFSVLLSKTILAATLVGLPFVPLGFAFGDHVLLLLSGQTIPNAGLMVGTFAVASILTAASIITNGALIAAHLFRVRLLVVAVGVVAVFWLGFELIPTHGALGGVFAYSGSMLLRLLMETVILFRLVYGRSD